MTTIYALPPKKSMVLTPFEPWRLEGIELNEIEEANQFQTQICNQRAWRLHLINTRIGTIPRCRACRYRRHHNEVELIPAVRCDGWIPTVQGGGETHPLAESGWSPFPMRRTLHFFGYLHTSTPPPFLPFSLPLPLLLFLWQVAISQTAHHCIHFSRILLNWTLSHWLLPHSWWRHFLQQYFFEGIYIGDLFQGGLFCVAALFQGGPFLFSKALLFVVRKPSTPTLVLELLVRTWFSWFVSIQSKLPQHADAYAIAVRISCQLSNSWQKSHLCIEICSACFVNEAFFYVPIYVASNVIGLITLKT